MRRARKQTGYIYKRGGWWVLRYRQTVNQGGQLMTKQRAVQLVPVGPHYKTKASLKNLVEEKLKQINHWNQKPETVVTIGDFVERVYLPHVVEHKRPSTQKTYRDIWEDHLDERIQGTLILGVETKHVQQWLEAIAAEDRTKDGHKLGRHSMKHVKSLLSGVFKHAAQQGFYSGANPARDTVLPPTPEPEETYAYSLEEILHILRVVREPASTVIAVAAFMGLRRGEIRGLLWENYRNGEIHISQSIWSRFATAPKTRKGRAPVPVILQLAERLEIHRLRSGNPSSGPIFRNATGRAMDLNNLLFRVIRPALKAAGIEWHGWHAFRRGLGSNLNRLGVDDSVIQAILRHSNIATTQAYYIKTSSEDAHQAMRKLESEIPLLCAERAPKVDSAVNPKRVN